MTVLKMNRTFWAWTAAALAVAAALAWAFAPRPIDVEVGVVSQGAFELAIEEDGRTRIKDHYTISAPVAARIARATLREGDRVAVGDTVAVLTPTMSSMVDARSVREATARLKAASAGIQRASARAERAKVALEEARRELQRTERLAAEGFISAAGLDTARLGLAGAQRELEVAAADREVAVHERDQAAAAVQPIPPGSSSGRSLAVRSPVSGVVLRVAVQSEGTIAPGTALLEVGDPARMEVVADLLTTDAVQARPGTRAVIERWGGPAIAARVRLVEPAAFTKVSALGIEEQRVKVLLDMVDPPTTGQTLGDGFRVGVRIITSSIEQARLVPVGALFPYEGGFAVYRLDGSRARLQPVDVRGRNPDFGWVDDSVPAGQQVIVYPPSTVADGKRVRLRKP